MFEFLFPASALLTDDHKFLHLINWGITKDLVSARLCSEHSIGHIGVWGRAGIHQLQVAARKYRAAVAEKDVPNATFEVACSSWRVVATHDVFHET
jgi:hypothetical protein